METSKQKIFEDEDVRFDVEEAEGFLFLHCEVFNYNRQVKAKVQELFESITDACIYFGWSALHAYTPNPKFAKMFGDPRVIDEVVVDGQNLEVLRWELEPQLQP